MAEFSFWGSQLPQGQSVAADSLTLDGLAFTALLPDQGNKHLGVRMNISKLWSTGYKQAWYKKAARSADATPMILSYDNAGRIALQPLKLAMRWICMTNV